jgi:hypothetical protein
VGGLGPGTADPGLEEGGDPLGQFTGLGVGGALAGLVLERARSLVRADFRPSLASIASVPITAAWSISPSSRCFLGARVTIVIAWSDLVPLSGLGGLR